MTVMLLSVVALALALDYLLGEPKNFHPLIGFGRWVDQLEKRFNQGVQSKANGIIAWSLAVIPVVLIVSWIDSWLSAFNSLAFVWSALVLYICIGWTSLLQHSRDVSSALLSGDLPHARRMVARIVSRDTEALDETGVSRGAIESILENGADAIFAAIFWFCILGVPGVVLYRLVNTLDAMWGYKNPRFLEFGWWAAVVDDVFNYIPARLTALSYALLGDTRQAMACWKKQGSIWKSPNAGPVMAAGAGSLNISLGGPEIYHGELQQRSVLGPEKNKNTAASAHGIEQASRLVNRTLAFWFVVMAILIISVSIE